MGITEFTITLPVLIAACKRAASYDRQSTDPSPRGRGLEPAPYSDAPVRQANQFCEVSQETLDSSMAFPMMIKVE